jgi:hypothetical protein
MKTSFAAIFIAAVIALPPTASFSADAKPTGSVSGRIKVTPALREETPDPPKQKPKLAPPQQDIVDVDINIPRGGEKAGKYDIAVVIGNRDYATYADSVEYAIRDAAVMKEYLKTLMGYDPANILYYENANLSQFFNLFGTRDEPRGKLADYVKAGESRVFIYYAGHGAPDVDSNESYFVPVGADIQRLKINGYRQQTLYDNLAKLGAKSVTVVLDTCFSGMSPTGGFLVKGISAVSRTPSKVDTSGNILRITSSGDNQVSTWYPEMKHGLFTYYYLKGLRGEADANRDGKITAAEMRVWLEEHVPYWANRLNGKQQKPEVKGDDSAVLAVLK